MMEWFWEGGWRRVWRGLKTDFEWFLGGFGEGWSGFEMVF